MHNIMIQNNIHQDMINHKNELFSIPVYHLITNSHQKPPLLPRQRLLLGTIATTVNILLCAWLRFKVSLP